jgi:hypothetical protein
MANPDDGTTFSFGWATARVAVGGGPVDAGRARSLHDRDRVTHVLYLRRDEGDTLALARHGIIVRHNPAADDGAGKTNAWFQRSLRFALDTLKRPRTRLLVTCWHGQCRAPATAYAVLLALGIPEGRAWEMVLAARPEAQSTYCLDALRAVRELGYL